MGIILSVPASSAWGAVAVTFSCDNDATPTFGGGMISKGGQLSATCQCASGIKLKRTSVFAAWKGGGGSAATNCSWCGDGGVTSPEVCDYSGPNAGWCNPTCTAIVCPPGLYSNAAAAPNGCVIPVSDPFGLGKTCYQDVARVRQDEHEACGPGQDLGSGDNCPGGCFDRKNRWTVCPSDPGVQSVGMAQRGPAVLVKCCTCAAINATQCDEGDYKQCEVGTEEGDDTGYQPKGDVKCNADGKGGNVVIQGGGNCVAKCKDCVCGDGMPGTGCDDVAK